MFQEIDNKALAAKSGDQGAVKDLVDSIFAQNGIDQFNSNLVDSLKDRVVRAQLNGRMVSEIQVVQAINWLMGQCSAPAYAQTSLLQIRITRLQMNSVMPNLFAEKESYSSLDLSKPPNSQPLVSIPAAEAVTLLTVIVHQKVLNPNYQKEPAQWDADFVARVQAGCQTQNNRNSGPELRARTTSPQTSEMQRLIYGTSRNAADWGQMAQGVLDQLGIQT